jgi:hypothetical protein
MTRYLIIAAAILVGVLLRFLIARHRKPASETILVEEKPLHLIPWVAGILTLLIGLYLISDDTRAPIDAEYHPSVLIDGELVPGNFDDSEGGSGDGTSK